MPDKKEKKGKKEKKTKGDKKPKLGVRELYEFGDELGKGAFSIVIQGKRRSDGLAVALKIIDKKSLGDDKKSLQTEISILKRVHHKNIVGLLDVKEDESKVYLVMDLVLGGELFDRIVEKQFYSEAETADLLRKLCNALEYLHEQNIVHRDLKPENLLLRTKESDSEVCIADFGLSKIYNAETMLKTATGTPSYVAPEVLLGEAGGYTKKVDTWSVGVIAYILLCGFPPFYGDTVPEIFEKILSAKYDFPEQYWGKISSEAKNFVTSLLELDVEKRLDSTQAKNHIFLTGGNSDTKIEVHKDMKKYVETRASEQGRN